MAEEPLVFALFDAMEAVFVPALGRHVVVDVDGERVEGEVTGLGTQEAEHTTGSVWYLEVDGRRLTVTYDDLVKVCEGGGE